MESGARVTCSLHLNKVCYRCKDLPVTRECANPVGGDEETFCGTFLCAKCSCAACDDRASPPEKLSSIVAQLDRIACTRQDVEELEPVK